jgi:outer membrane immunogenic protein
MSLKFFFATSTALVLGAGASFAGGSVAPVIDVAPILIEETPVVGAWEGAYVGGSLNYSFGAEDQVGLDLLNGGQRVGRETELGDADINGISAGLNAGYRWQREKWVFGPELGIEAGNVDGSTDITAFGVDGNVESEMNYLVTLVMKTGYEVQPGTLVYGTFGIASGDFDYTVSADGASDTDSFTATGIAAGFGVERMINENMSVFADYQYRDLSKETVTYEDNGSSVETNPTTAHSNIRVGVNYNF